MACYEDLRALYAATAKERDELKKELKAAKEEIKRMKVYEGTGLESEDMLRIYNLLRLVGEDFNCRLVYVSQALVKYAEYTKAEEEGRLVVLPCKVRDTVYKANRASNRVATHKVRAWLLLYAGARGAPAGTLPGHGGHGPQDVLTCPRAGGWE